MSTRDYIYRFDLSDPSIAVIPENAESAKVELEHGNQLFAEWMKSGELDSSSNESTQFVIKCGRFHDAGGGNQSQVMRQEPFAVVIGCSDARVPIEMVFGQSFNELFVVRVAGNVLADECWGSIDYAVQEFSKSVKLIIVLGHSGCGAVTAAVDAYLEPQRLAMGNTSFVVRSVLDHIFVPVHHAARGLSAAWGPRANELPGYRKALIESAVCLNAATAAYNIRVGNHQLRHSDMRVLYGVYDLQTHRVRAPANEATGHNSDLPIRLTDAPADVSEFESLAFKIADRLKPNDNVA
jgi:carbonic anhydrase